VPQPLREGDNFRFTHPIIDQGNFNKGITLIYGNEGFHPSIHTEVPRAPILIRPWPVSPSRMLAAGGLAGLAGHLGWDSPHRI